MKRSSTISLLVVLWLAAGAASAQQGMVQPAPETPELELSVLLHQLEERGITLSLGYTAEIFSAVSGGIGRGRRSDYLGSFAASLTLDFSRIGFGRGQFYMSGQTLHGRGISESRIGTAQALSKLEEQRFSRFIRSLVRGFLPKRASEGQDGTAICRRGFRSGGKRRRFPELFLRPESHHADADVPGS